MEGKDYNDFLCMRRVSLLPNIGNGARRDRIRRTAYFTEFPELNIGMEVDLSKKFSYIKEYDQLVYGGYYTDKEYNRMRFEAQSGDYQKYTKANDLNYHQDFIMVILCQ